MIRLAVDVQSGDYGPDVTVRGILDARKAASVPFVTYLCGNRDEINHILDDLEKTVSFDRSEFIVEHSSDLISEEDWRSMVWKNRKGSSIVRCVSLQKEGKADASISAGDTGILIGTALFILGRGEGISRPALGAFIPTATHGNPVLVLDVGANLNCRAEHLASFAQMGSSYVSRLFSKPVRTALLNIGAEPSKGPKVVRDAAELLEKKDWYTGFIEGNKVFSGDADVVVCDGFLGNVLLKACESFYSLAADFLAGNQSVLELLIHKMDVLNPENYGAVPFLGIRGTVLKAHGGSSVRSIRNAVLTALGAVKNNVTECWKN
ncbi:MAG: phosphate acyltransferase [Chitinispirillales bacterium]|nr:phosphate acyltransferase [Chitinispirillales bacterium]